MLLVHIIIASASVFYTAYVFFFPTKPKLNVSYILVGATLVTGFGLLFTRPAHMAQICTEGLVYVGVMLVGIFAVRQKLAKQLVQ